LHSFDLKNVTTLLMVDGNRDEKCAAEEVVLEMLDGDDHEFSALKYNVGVDFFFSMSPS